MVQKHFICKFCGKDFIGYDYPNKHRIYCSKKCQNEDQKKRFIGENNPNFGNKWNDKQRQRASAYQKEVMKDPNKRYIAGSANRGKKINDKIRKNMSGHTPWNKGKTGIFSEETLLKISKKSKEKFENKDYCDKYKKTMIERGYWRDNISEQEVYYKLSNWQERMYDKIDDEKQLQRLKEFGVFNSISNTKGLVRDHIYGRRSGYINGVYPEILRHPCNCQLLSNIENIKKKTDRYIDRNNIELENLFDKIKKYKKEWSEQELVLQLIKKYENGERWSIERNT